MLQDYSGKQFGMGMIDCYNHACNFLLWLGQKQNSEVPEANQIIDLMYKIA
jgi:hypothetical protein